jgi:hypothetical protein
MIIDSLKSATDKTQYLTDNQQSIREDSPCIPQHKKVTGYTRAIYSGENTTRADTVINMQLQPPGPILYNESSQLSDMFVRKEQNSPDIAFPIKSS